MNTPPIYLDYNATTPLYPEVVECMTEALAHPHNASSVHRWGREGKAILEQARRTIAHAISAFPNEVIFTASGTEANNMALRGFPDHRIAVSAVEHPSVLQATPDAVQIPVNKNGLIQTEALEKRLARHPEPDSGSQEHISKDPDLRQDDALPLLVSIQLANNETGVIQPIAEIARLVHAHGGLLHCDAAQAFGKVPVDFGLLGADILTFSAHKFGGPQGAGVLIVRDKLAIAPLLRGGGQELRRRAGTENIAAIAGFAKAVECMRDLSHLRGWMDTLEASLHKASGEHTTIFGQNIPRLPNTTCLTMPNVTSETQLMHFDLAGIALSAGSACSSGRVEASHVLQAMGATPETATCALRISTGWNTRQRDLDAFATAWKALYARTHPANTETIKHAAHP